MLRPAQRKTLHGQANECGGALDSLFTVEIRRIDQLSRQRFGRLKRQEHRRRANVLRQPHALVYLCVIVVVGTGQHPAGGQRADGLQLPDARADMWW